MEDLDKKFMEMALAQATVSKQNGDVPFGAVIVCKGKVIAAAGNGEQVYQDITRHAELQAVSLASRALGSLDLNTCTLYSTVEPCTMCASAILYSAVRRIVYGMSRDDLPHLFRSRKVRFSHLAQDWHYGPQITAGVLKDKAIEIFLDYKQPFRLPIETKAAHGKLGKIEYSTG